MPDANLEASPYGKRCTMKDLRLYQRIVNVVHLVLLIEGSIYSSGCVNMNLKIHIVAHKWILVTSMLLIRGAYSRTSLGNTHRRAILGTT